MSQNLKLVLLIFVCLSCVSLFAQEPGCAQISLRGQMARARRIAVLADLKKKAGADPRIELVFAARKLELNSTSKTAADSLLDLLPKYESDPYEDDPIRSRWLDLIGLQACLSGGISLRELKALSLLESHLPRLLAKAVLLSPEKMPVYVGHTQLFITPDSDFPIHMQTVCRRQHQTFLNAVDKFSSKDKQWFETIIFNPKTCRTIYHPEQ